MSTIWKYTLHAPKNIIEMPVGAEILDVHEQNGEVCIWALVDELKAASEDRTFMLIGTGQKLMGTYIGSAHVHPFVWHVTEVTK